MVPFDRSFILCELFDLRFCCDDVNYPFFNMFSDVCHVFGGLMSGLPTDVNHCSYLQGDILFLHMSKDPIRAGEIVVFNVDVSSLLSSYFI